MKAVGTLEGINMVMNVLKREHIDTEGNICHLYRTDACVTWGPEAIDDEGHYSILIEGDVAWSLSGWLDASGDPYTGNDGKRYRCISLPRLSHMSGVSFEAFGEECGFEFSQHICITDGRVYIDHTVDWIDSELIIKGMTADEIRDSILNDVLADFKEYLNDEDKAQLMKDVDAMIERAVSNGWTDLFYKFGGFDWVFASPIDILKGHVWGSKPLFSLRGED